MPDATPQVDGDDSFGVGMDSFTMATKLNPGEYVLSMNTINRGGIIQTRPGSSNLPAVFTSAAGTNIQGLSAFTPNGSSGSVLLAAINGAIYTIRPPFDSTIQFSLPGIQFNSNSKYIAWAACIQTTFIDELGEIQFLETPRPVLVMQDGATRAAFWDGSESRHLNPLVNETPVGLWMCWSNNRLWVSKGNQIFASDIGNPLSFTEGTYINEGRAFYLPGPCTGIVETPDRKGILCFTSDSVTLIQSSIQDRTLWLQTKDFQSLVIAGIGCVAPRSIVQQYGMVWWYSARGLISLDDALRSYITSKIYVKDNELAQIKYNADSDPSMICGASIENFMLQALPVGQIKNNWISVMDQAAVEDQPEGNWSSYWTGWQPVEFANAEVGGVEYLFLISSDYDNFVRIWQLFKSDKTDAGIPITSYVVTKTHLGGNRDYKRFKYAEVEMTNIVGPVAVAIGARGTRGAFQKIMEKDINSVNGQVYHNQIYGFNANDFAGTRPQSRIVRTTDTPQPNECSSECVEYAERGLIDKGFSLVIAWSGEAGISAYRVFYQSWPQNYDGICEDDETGENRLVNANGCGIIGLFSTSIPFPAYYSDVNYTFTFQPGTQGSVVYPDGTRTDSFGESFISQIDSYRKALGIAKFKADQLIQLLG